MNVTRTTSTNSFKTHQQNNLQNGHAKVVANIRTKCCHNRCPPDGVPAHFLYLAVTFVLIWAVGTVATGDTFLPGGNIFGIGIVGVACWTGGQISGALGLPQLFGILAVGFGLRNIPYINVAADIEYQWLACVRNISVAMVITRAGLTINLSHLKKHKWSCLRLGVLPNLIEAATNTIISHFLLDMPWLYSAMLAFMTTGVSLIIVVPCMVVIQDQGLGEDKGVATLAMSAGGIDNILAAAGFGITLNLAFSEESPAMQVLHPILSVALGVVAAAVLGTIAWYLPSRSQDGIAFMRVIFILCGSTLIVFVGKEMGYTGCGALGVILISLIAAHRWRQMDDKLVEVIKAYNVLVAIFKPLLLGLIGAQFPVEYVDAKTAGLTMVVVSCGLFIRMVCAYLVCYGHNYSPYEKLFIAVTWIPKVTFEAAVSYTALDMAQQRNAAEDVKRYCSNILIAAIMCIMVTGPIGLGCIQRLAPKLLNRTDRVNTEISLVHVHSMQEAYM